MRQYFEAEGMKKQFKIHSIIAGILLLIAGILSIFLPTVTSLTISFLLGWLLVISGIISGYHVIKSYNTKWISWLKPFLLFFVGLLMLLYPLEGIAAVSLLLILYFLIDAFAGIVFGLEWSPLKGWALLIINGILSLVLAIIFIIGWPFSSIWLIGLLVGISLLFDSATILMLGISMKRNF